ncbi:hypothetical protein AB0C02_23310 [Micromonospora sp. NPDC048999]|uniref:hypothetical protein n=1 Tax=Micromonospora sp. NPDC048999 TaxID=3155391 RepID=UPI0033F972DF
MRARRLIAVASVAAGLVALSGCRSEPGVAAYVGDHRITENAVTSLLDELRDKLSVSSQESGASPEEAAQSGPQLPARSEVVTDLVLLDVCQRLAADKGYQSPQRITAEDVATQYNIPADTAYAERVAELITCRTSLPAEPVAPTEQELADLLAAGKAAGVIPAEMTLQNATAQLDGDQLREALGQKKLLREAFAGYGITINPRYRPLEIPLLNFAAGHAALSVPLGELGTDAVTDISTPEPKTTDSTDPDAS